MTVTVLPNGLTVVVEPDPGAFSVASGIWIGAGSGYETPAESGASHFLEHMLFKGTQTRSSFELAAAIDRLGGEVNATTGKESTVYYARTLPHLWEQGLELLGEMLLGSRLAADDFERERQVILEELRGDGDAPETLAMDTFDKSLWPRHPLGRPVAGTVKSVQSLTVDQILQVKHDLYTPDNAVVSVAGAISPEAAVAAVIRVLGGWQGRRGRARSARPAAARPRVVTRRRRLDQVHLCVGAPAPSLGAEQMPAGLVLSSLLGGGPSSRLFQRIREQEGLAYNIYAFYDTYVAAGVLGVYGAVAPEGAAKTLRLIREELASLAAGQIDQDELERAKVQLTSGLLLGLETSHERMNRNGEWQLLLGRIPPPREVAAAIDGVTPAAVAALAKSLAADGVLSLAAVGRVRPDELGEACGLQTKSEP